MKHRNNTKRRNNMKRRSNKRKNKAIRNRKIKLMRGGAYQLYPGMVVLDVNTHLIGGEEVEFWQKQPASTSTGARQNN